MSSHPLKILTHMVPDMPLELFQTYQYLLEKVLSVRGLLSIENRLSDLGKTLDSANIDIAFLSSTCYIKLMKETNQYELLPLAPVFESTGRIQIESEVIIAKDKSEEFKNFVDLKGHKWAVSDSECVSSFPVLLGQLRQMGYNAHFFGNLIRTKHQREVIRNVLGRTAEAGAVDSGVLGAWAVENPEAAEELKTLTTWGPFAPDAIVVRKEMAENVRAEVRRALLHISREHPEFAESFRRFGIVGFEAYNPELFHLTEECLELAKEQKLYPVYY